MPRFRPIAPKPSPPQYPPIHPPAITKPPTKRPAAASIATPPKRPNMQPPCGFASRITVDNARAPRHRHFDPFAVAFLQDSVNDRGTYVEATRNFSCESTEASDGRQPVCKIGRATGYVDGGNKFEKDVAFMERAAASAPPTVLPERWIGGGAGPKDSHFGGNFTQVIKSITGLTSAVDVRSVMHPKWTGDVKGSTIDITGGEASLGFTFPMVRPMDCLADDEGDGAKLVTLHLPPEISSASGVNSPEEPSVSTCTFLNSRPSWFASLSEDDVGVALTSKYSRPPFLDQRYIEKVYNASPDPVLLIDDFRQVLWFNKAYERAAKANLERISDNGVGMGPFIDLLGLPTRLGTFNLRSSEQTGSSSATLWGFLKKIVVPDLQSASDAVCSTPGSFAADRGGQKNKVIMPQPKRLVGSTVSLESVTEVHLQAEALSGRMEEMEKKLEEGTLPAFMTDASNRVRWVNTAYKKMVGQPECPWLANTVMSNGGGMGTSSSSSRITGEVLLVGTNEKIPEMAAAFSGRVNIQWTNRGERSSMTVPCDVTRLCGRSRERVFVWKFDIGSSLRLTCGS